MEGKFTFFAITWIRFIGSRQNLAWIYYLTLGTSLRKNFSFFSKSKMAAGGQKFVTRYTYECFCNFFAITSIRFIGFRQNLAWTYYLTLGTSLRRNFSFFSKSKMAAGGQKLRRVILFQCFCNNLDPVYCVLHKSLFDYLNNLLTDCRNVFYWWYIWRIAGEFEFVTSVYPAKIKSPIKT